MSTMDPRQKFSLASRKQKQKLSSVPSYSIHLFFRGVEDNRMLRAITESATLLVFKACLARNCSLISQFGKYITTSIKSQAQ